MEPMQESLQHCFNLRMQVSLQYCSNAFISSKMFQLVFASIPSTLFQLTHASALSTMFQITHAIFLQHCFNLQSLFQYIWTIQKLGLSILTVSDSHYILFDSTMFFDDASRDFGLVYCELTENI